VENLLDIDFDGAVPASLQGQSSGSTGIEDLVGDGPSEDTLTGGAPGTTNNMDDLMGIFDNEPGTSTSAVPASSDLMNGFGGLSIESNAQQTPQSQKKTNDDILGLF
jgi:AP-1 complex subunit beta-1